MSMIPDEYLGDPSRPGPTTDANGKNVICDQIKKNGDPCPALAQNGSSRCFAHGGGIPPELKAPKKEIALTRQKQLEAGILSVEELDDEEIARGQCRASNGTFVGRPPKTVPRAIHQRMIRELYRRADAHLEENLLDCVKVITEIATNPRAEDRVRFAAAQYVLERVRGKVPDVVVHAQEKPFEHVLERISGGSREESRAARQLESKDNAVLEAEIVPDSEE